MGGETSLPSTSSFMNAEGSMILPYSAIICKYVIASPLLNINNVRGFRCSPELVIEFFGR